jgi:hypothetical protein
MWPLVDHVLDEIYHPEMAGKDFLRLGGDAARLDPAHISPAALVAASRCSLM